MPLETTSQRVGANVRAEMARHRLSQERIAKQLNISQQALSQRLGGKVAFRVDELDSLADILSVSITDLMRRHRKEVPA